MNNAEQNKMTAKEKLEKLADLLGFCPRHTNERISVDRNFAGDYFVHNFYTWRRQFPGETRHCATPYEAIDAALAYLELKK